MRRLVMLCCLVLSVGPSLGFAQGHILVVGTGSVVGLYYPVGGAVSLIVNKAQSDMLLTVQVTEGSVTNLELLLSGKVQLALAQSDVAYQAFRAEAPFSDLSGSQLRTLMGLHEEPLHLVCNRDANVESLRDIVGKRVGVGPDGSGILHTVRRVLDAYALSETDFKAMYLAPDNTPEYLDTGKIDCFFYTVGVGGAAIRATAIMKNIRLVPLDEPELQRLVDENPYYAFVTVPAGTYRGVNEDVTLFGVKALLMTTTAMSETTAYTIVKASLDAFSTLTETHPALATLEKTRINAGLSAPLHPGALRAYVEAGFTIPAEQVESAELE